MAGQWLYRRDRDLWCLLMDGEQAITITGEMLKMTCKRTGLNRRETLRWVASRPTGPFKRLVA